MKFFLKYILFFFISTIILDRCIYFILNNYFIAKSEFRYSRYFIENPDVIILGNSRGVHSINEDFWDKIYNNDLINLSFNGMSASALNSIINDLSNLENAIVGIEISSFMTWTVNDSTEKVHKGPYNINADFRTYRKYFPSINKFFNKKDNVFNSIYYCLDFNNNLLPYVFKYLFKDDRAWSMDRVVGKNEIENLDNIEFIKLYFHEDLFSELLNIIDKKGISRVFFYESPWLKEYVDKMYNYDEIHEKINSYNILYYNLHTDFPSDHSYYADYLHTNTKSQKIISKIIYNIINSENNYSE
tara:strand:+ start:26440 stop:27342 length:903 start_codon:yes stop_codon:yes gene_type:complete